MNSIIISGNLVSDPTLRHTSSNLSVCSFRVAVAREKAAEGQQKADFIDVIAWRKTAEFVHRYFCKGKPIMVSGRLQIRDYEYNGEKRKAVEVVANTVEFAGGQKFDRQSGATPGTPAAEIGLGDVPFVVGGEVNPFNELDDSDLPL